jgi:hypothetical protein
MKCKIVCIKVIKRKLKVFLSLFNDFSKRHRLCSVKLKDEVPGPFEGTVSGFM